MHCVDFIQQNTKLTNAKVLGVTISGAEASVANLARCWTVVSTLRSWVTVKKVIFKAAFVRRWECDAGTWVGVVGIFFFSRPRLLLVTGDWLSVWRSPEVDLLGLDRVLEEDLDRVHELRPVFLAGGCLGIANSNPTTSIDAKVQNRGTCTI